MGRTSSKVPLRKRKPVARRCAKEPDGPATAHTVCRKCIQPALQTNPYKGPLTWSYGNWWVSACAQCIVREEVQQEEALCQAVAQATPAGDQTNSTTETAPPALTEQARSRMAPLRPRAWRQQHLCDECGEYVAVRDQRGNSRIEDGRVWSTSCYQCRQAAVESPGPPPPGTNGWPLPPPRQSLPRSVPPEPPP